MGTEVGKLKARLQLLEQAVSVDPRNVDALAALARNKSILVFAGWSASAADDLRSAYECAERALEIDQDNAVAWFARGQVLLARRDFAAALECYERAIDLNPSLANARQLHGVALIGLGRASEAFAPVQEAIRISPRDFYIADYYMTLGWAHWELDQYEEAVGQLRRSVAQNSKFEASYFLLASSLKQLGQEDEAVKCVETVMATNSSWTVERIKASYPVRAATIRKLGDDLLMLGLPER